MWQFYFSPPTGRRFGFTVATTRRVARYTVHAARATSASPGRHGEIDTERWHRRSEDGKTEAIVWLAPSLNYIPVKMRVSQHQPRHRSRRCSTRSASTTKLAQQ